MSFTWIPFSWWESSRARTNTQSREGKSGLSTFPQMKDDQPSRTWRNVLTDQCSANARLSPPTITPNSKKHYFGVFRPEQITHVGCSLKGVLAPCGQG